MRKIKLKAFTLVELIIVITILAILATIAFVSFQSYTVTARDSNRVADISTIQKGIDLYQVQTGKVPMVDDKSGTGTLDGNAVTHIGYIGDTITKLIKLHNIPLDPSTKSKYVYGVDYTLQKYQIATIIENLQVQTGPMLSTTYADAGLKARVVGNYNGFLKYNNKLYNIPSLIITFSGTTTQDLTSANTNYIIDKSENLPYLAVQAKQLNALTPTQVLQKLTNSGANLVVTGVTIPTDASTWSASSVNLQTTLGYPADVIGQEVFGNTYLSSIKASSATALAQSSTSRYPGCDTDDIVLPNGQKWAACNVGATLAGTGVASYGKYFQRGRNDPLDLTITKYMYQYTGALINGSTGNNNFYAGDSTYFDWWKDEQGYSVTNRWTGSKPQGPCQNGYYVATQSDWISACNAIKGSACTNGEVNTTLVADIQNRLLLPYSGRVAAWDGSVDYTGLRGRYWTSTVDTSVSHIFYFYSGGIYTNYSSSGGNRGYGYSIRCIKS